MNFSFTKTEGSEIVYHCSSGQRQISTVPGGGCDPLSCPVVPDVQVLERELPGGWDCWKEDLQVRTKAPWLSVVRPVEERA